MKRNCKEKPKEEALADKSTKSSTSTGPLPTPGGPKGPTPQHTAQSASEGCWATTELGSNTLN